jgi:hypothetical protein
MLYVAFVASIMTTGENLFGDKPSICGPVTLLMLFVLSTADTGLLVLGKPVILFMSGKKGSVHIPSCDFSLAYSPNLFNYTKQVMTELIAYL